MSFKNKGKIKLFSNIKMKEVLTSRPALHAMLNAVLEEEEY